MITLQFLKNRETKGAILFNEVDDKRFPKDMASASIGALYIRKSSEIGKLNPDMITVTVEAVR